MDKQLPKLYREYGQYSNYRNFPLDIDGLKPVERRVLLTAYKIARTKLAKCLKVSSYTNGNYHPHGECITGNTKILLLDGTVECIKDLLHKENFWVYSCKEDGQIVPGLAHSVRVTKKVTKLYKITLDNDKFIECTDDHLFMLRNGNYKKASELTIGDSLMPLYLRKEDGYTFYRDNSRKICREEKVAWMVVRNLINENIDNLLGQKKYHTHHKNEKRNDDRPENLELLFYKDHISETMKNRSEEINKMIGQKVKKAFHENKNNFKEKALKGLEKGRDKMFTEGSLIREKIKEKNSKIMTEYNHKYVEDRILKILKKMLNNEIEINENNYEIYRKYIYNGPLWKTILKKFDTIDKAIKIAKDYNHTIKNIETINLENPIEVYDLSVEKYHNFAVESGIFVHNCYGTIVQLVKQGFLVGQGNFGANVGVEPTGAAAPRYTECKIDERTVELAFKYVNYVNWIPTELDDKEPEFLPTMYPLCLLGSEPTQGIGFGFKTHIPCYSPDDLQKRLLWLLGIRKRKPIIAPITDCKIVASNDDLDQLLTTGKAKIDVEGIIDINPRSNTVVLRSWPPGKRFESFLNKFSKELSDGLIGFRDASVTETEIIFQVLRERNRDKIFKSFVEKLTEVIKGTISYEMQVINYTEQIVVLKSVDQMLLDTYKMYTHINTVMLETEKQRISNAIAELLALEMIRRPLSECMKENYDIPTTLQYITQKTPVKYEVADELIKKYRIAKLLTLDTDTSTLSNNLKEYEQTLTNISKFVLEQYGGFK